MATGIVLTAQSSITLPQAVPLWAEADQPRYTAIVDSDGNFNGTCSMTEESIPLLLDDNMCASWFHDITVFCCGAVGGILQQANNESTATGNTNDTTPSNSEADFEPVCVTTNYHDMLDCYTITSLDSCGSNDVSPYGICNAAGNLDTSRTTSHENGIIATTKTPHRMVLLLSLLLPLLSAVLW